MENENHKKWIELYLTIVYPFIRGVQSTANIYNGCWMLPNCTFVFIVRNCKKIYQWNLIRKWWIHIATSSFPVKEFHSLSISRWHFIPSPLRLWWQNLHSRGWSPVLYSSHKLFLKKVQLLCEKTCSATLPSLPLKAGDKTPKVKSGDSSSIILFPILLFMPASASFTVHQPGRRQ